jgi:hemolysin III
MASLTGSFRMSDIHSSALTRRRATAGTAAISPTESITNFARSAILSVPAIDSAPSLPGFETAAKVAQALTRPAYRTRTDAEELHEERLNTITHGLGFVLSLAGFAYLLSTAMTSGGWVRFASCGVYGLSLLAMYAASTSLHAAECPKQKLRFQVADHVAIYLLIAGTYTPFLAGLMQGYLGWTLLACVWALAAIGIAIKLRYAERLEETSPLPYVGLGWLVMAAIKPLMAVLPVGGMALLVAGGVSYSAGVLFYCRDDKRYFHAIWHLFVMVGTACHFCAVLFYVAA